MTSHLYAHDIRAFYYPRFAEPLQECIRERELEVCAVFSQMVPATSASDWSGQVNDRNEPESPMTGPGRVHSVATSSLLVAQFQ